jgi:hypothetical protein
MDTLLMMSGNQFKPVGVIGGRSMCSKPCMGAPTGLWSLGAMIDYQRLASTRLILLIFKQALNKKMEFFKNNFLLFL